MKEQKIIYSPCFTAEVTQPDVMKQILEMLKQKTGQEWDFSVEDDCIVLRPKLSVDVSE